MCRSGRSGLALEEANIMSDAENALTLSPELERRKKIKVKDAAKLKAISETTFRRRYPYLIEQVSDRRQACTLGKVLDAE
jgi:hypothetical protein